MIEVTSGLAAQLPALPDPAEAGIQDRVVAAVLWLRLVVEVLGALVVGVGVLVATHRVLRTWATPGANDFSPIRRTLARYLILALEFQVGADILATAVAPTWDHIGKLGAIVLIRTTLVYFLTWEMRAEPDGE